jgi:hypothetical protein
VLEEAPDEVRLFLAAVEVASGAVEQFVGVAGSFAGEGGVFGVVVEELGGVELGAVQSRFDRPCRRDRSSITVRDDSVTRCCLCLLSEELSWLCRPLVVTVASVSC